MSIFIRQQAIKLLALHFTVAISLPLLAQQYQASPLEAQNRNPVLQQLSIGENIGDIQTGDVGLSAFWASSFLQAEGTAPRVANTSGLNADDREELLSEHAQAYDAWTEMYGPRKASDGDTTTAWVEGVKGQGIGEVLLVKVDTSRPVSIWAGFGKSERSFRDNSRPRKIRLWVLQAQDMDVGEGGEIYKDVTALAYHDIELRDFNGWQTLNLPKHKLNDLSNKHFPDGKIPAGRVSFIAIEIQSVYPGSKFADTAISELANR